MLKLAFAGFRHVHIGDMYAFAKDYPEVEIRGAAEDHAQTREAQQAAGVEFTHDSVDELLADAASFDVLAVGDYFGRRGSLAIRALEAGKHVMVDKPLCTSMEELDRIEALSREKGLVVGCMMDNRDSASMITIKRLVSEGVIGRVLTVNFMGQHPLMYGTRPMWYFEEGKHGGTINDIAVHAVDILPWLLGTEIDEVVAARGWNDSFTEAPDFELCAQMMLRMSDGAGVMGDVSYLSPNSQGYTVPQYWRYTIHGEKGILETGFNLDDVGLWIDGEEGKRTVPLDPERKGGYLMDLVAEVGGVTEGLVHNTAQVIASSRVTLRVQAAADTGATGVKLRG